MLAVFAAACGGSAAPITPAPAGLQTTVRIGFTASQTGSLTNESKEQTQGLRMWADEVNARGGIRAGAQAHPVELKSYDDESKQDRVQQLYTRLITEDKADFLISPYGSATAAASAVVTEQYGKTNLVVGAASDSTFTRGYRHAFQVYSPASVYLSGAMDMLARLDPSARRLALVHEKEPFSTDVVNAARSYAEQHGFQVVLFEGYDTGTSDFAPFISKIAAATPDAILGGGHFTDGSTLARQLGEKHVQARLVALLVAPAVPEFAQVGDAATGVVAPSQWEPQVAYSAEAARALGLDYAGVSAHDFTANYRQRYGYEPGYHAAAGYATGVILEKAIGGAGSIQPDAVEAALAHMDLMTFYGHIKFNTDQNFGLQTGHQMVYLQWQKATGTGALERTLVWPEEAASSKPVYPKP
jgi:ABC-type branched-subunit amino acid transport system substrate-binding protein